MKRPTFSAFLLLIIFSFVVTNVEAKKKKETDKSDTCKSSTFKGLKWRSIGPAFASGRIADFAVNPDNPAHYFVAVGSGNIWKTTNNGTTFEPVFENYGAYFLCNFPINRTHIEYYDFIAGFLCTSYAFNFCRIL